MMPKHVSSVAAIHDCKAGPLTGPEIRVLTREYRGGVKNLKSRSGQRFIRADPITKSEWGLEEVLLDLTYPSIDRHAIDLASREARQKCDSDECQQRRNWGEGVESVQHTNTCKATFHAWRNLHV